jgi:hypothetical protein
MRSRGRSRDRRSASYEPRRSPSPKRQLSKRRATERAKISKANTLRKKAVPSKRGSRVDSDALKNKTLHQTVLHAVQKSAISVGVAVSDSKRAKALNHYREHSIHDLTATEMRDFVQVVVQRWSARGLAMITDDTPAKQAKEFLDEIYASIVQAHLQRLQANKQHKDIINGVSKRRERLNPSAPGPYDAREDDITYNTVGNSQLKLSGISGASIVGKFASGHAAKPCCTRYVRYKAGPRIEYPHWNESNEEYLDRVCNNLTRFEPMPVTFWDYHNVDSKDVQTVIHF